jgi:hypothetical protein
VSIKPVADSSITANIETAILRALELGADLRWVIGNPPVTAPNAIIGCAPLVCINCGGSVAFNPANTGTHSLRAGCTLTVEQR